MQEMLGPTVFLVFGREGQAFSGQHSTDSGLHMASKSLYGTHGQGRPCSVSRLSELGRLLECKGGAPTLFIWPPAYMEAAE